jgi:hypothetical protein
MLEFALSFEKVLVRWPDNTPWTIAQIADFTNSSITTSVDAVSTTLNREFDVHETITPAEGRQVLAILKERLHRQFEAREQRIQANRDAAMRAYDLTMDRVRVSQLAKDWRGAYKSLSYFVGRYDKHIDHDLLVTLCGDCIRVGSRAGFNTQETGQWFRKAVEAAILSGSTSILEDALDFVDAYGEIFSSDVTGVGAKILKNALTILEIPAIDCNLGFQWLNLNNSLRG